jgi:hypothetical protein
MNGFQGVTSQYIKVCYGFLIVGIAICVGSDKHATVYNFKV